MHLHLDQWIGLGEAGENARQKAHGVVIRCADAHCADHMRHAQGIEHFAMQLEYASRITEQDLALGSQAHLASVTFE
ncbi:hypothetical protein D3C77_386220 [compost metagenome]